MSRWERRVALGGWVSVVAVATLALHRAGNGSLAPPPVGQPGAWSAWLAGRDPVVAAVAILRLLALVAAWYLLVASAVGATLRLVRARRLTVLADQVTVPALRRLLVATASVSLVAGLMSHPALARSASPSPAVVTSTSHPLVTTAAPTTVTTVTTVPTDSGGGGRSPPTIRMHLIVPEEPAAAPAAVPQPAAVAPVPVPPAAAATTTWTVRPGECFWSIADDVLARAWGRPPTDAEIVPYWRTLIEENRRLLGDRSNPDLIWVGQVFAIPPTPPKAA